MRRHQGFRRGLRRAVGMAATVVVFTGLLVGLTVAESANGATAADFAPGALVSDAMFYNSGTMQPSDIQNFLESKEPSCSPGYTCMKNYTESVTSRPADARCGAFSGGMLSAARIIFNVATACGINPQVLLTMLEKEQGLVSAVAPSSSRYRIAMGYACPDTAACDTAYYGFSNQVFSAAHQFKVYQAYPNSWNFRADRYNAIAFNPDTACGSSQVYIQNQATAALYIYTPYQPNRAGLDNLYGLGDSCTAYGNRNFWRIFTDWFGDTQGGGSLVLAPGNPNVYLVSGVTRYLVPDVTALQSLMAVGPYRYVSQQSIDSLSNGGTITNLLRDPSNGDVFYIEGSGVKHRFASCDLVAQLGLSCGDAKNLQPWQLQKFPPAGEMSQFIKSSSSPTIYYLENGSKRPISAWATVASLYSQQAPFIYTVPTSQFNSYPVGFPLLGAATLVKSASGPQIYMIDGTQSKIPVVSFDTASDLGINGWTQASDADLGHYATAAAPLTITLTCGSTSYVGGSGALTAIADPAVSGLATTNVSQTTCNALRKSGSTIENGLFVKGQSSAALYYVTGGKKRFINQWSTVAALNAQQAPAIVTLSQPTLRSIGDGMPVLGPGTLVKSTGDPQIYMIDGLNSKVPVSAFEITSELGINGWSTVSDTSLLSSYSTTAKPLNVVVNCGASYYFGVRGQLWTMNSANGFGLASTPLDGTTCSALPHSAVATGPAFFIKTAADSTVYVLSAGTKRPVSSWNNAVILNGGASPVIATVGDYSLSTIPTGPAA